jgi:hypothetical protein
MFGCNIIFFVKTIFTWNFLAQALRRQGLCNPEGVFETPEYITLKPLKHSA